MTYYHLSGVCQRLNPESITIRFADDEQENFLSRSLAKYLEQVKRRISGAADDWDSAKKVTNPYEYVHTVLPHGKYAISKLKPLSRAFYKLIEICNVLDIFRKWSMRSIRSFHLAEGPGGFIEAMTHLRTCGTDVYHGMTLISDYDQNVPGWRKTESFLRRNPQVVIESGQTKNGDLYDPANYVYCLEKYKGSMDLITGDGGFDFSTDFGNQEAVALRLIFSQVAYAVGMQAPGGVFILKIFDTFLKASLDILYMLSCFYRNVYILKPNTSRHANSEKYVVCKHFRCIDNMDICRRFLSIMHVLNNSNTKDLRIGGFLSCAIPRRYILTVEEVNAIIGQQQMENILATLRFIENRERKSERYQQQKGKNVQKCIAWCVKNKIPHNRSAPTGNIFVNMSSRRKAF
jgi:23S rRNA U2552 (ribose-2'-O)-methylase RlmE/FtsJ